MTDNPHTSPAESAPTQPPASSGKGLLTLSFILSLIVVLSPLGHDIVSGFAARGRPVEAMLAVLTLLALMLLPLGIHRAWYGPGSLRRGSTRVTLSIILAVFFFVMYCLLLLWRHLW